MWELFNALQLMLVSNNNIYVRRSDVQFKGGSLGNLRVGWLKSLLRAYNTGMSTSGVEQGDWGGQYW